VSLVVPDVTVGSYDIKADVPLDGSVEASTPFSVPTPSITISPTSGPPGTSITVIGSNFKLGSTVTIFFDLDANGVVDPGESVGTATASSTGAFVTAVTAPTLPSGPKNVRATDGVNTASAVTFTITPAISLSPSSGPAGATITVAGNGFAANTPYDIWYDTNNNNQVDASDDKLADVTTDSSGTFSATVTIPVTATGSKAVMAIGDGLTGVPLASQTYTVNLPGITLSPASGPPGTSVTVTGSTSYQELQALSGSTQTTAVQLTRASRQVSVTASATGTFTATLTVPSVAAGSYNIKADVPSGGSVEASASFLVTPAISLSPASGPPGTSVTVSGSGFGAGDSGTLSVLTATATVNAMAVSRLHR
jgi:hypothetical protein